MQIDITQLVIWLLGVLATLVTSYLLPWLKAKAGNEKWNQLIKAAKIAAEAAEKLGATGKIENKLKWATELTNKTLAARKIVYDEQTVRAAIEARVRQL